MTTPIDDYPERFPYIPIFEDCIAYWDFRDGSLYDVVNNNNITLVNTPVTSSDHLSLQDYAYDFNGTTQYGDMPDSIGSSLTDKFTIICILNADTIGSSGFETFPYIFQKNTAIQTLVVDSAIKSRVYNGSWSGYTSQSISTANWYVYAITYGDGYLKSYLDGVNLNSVAKTGTLTDVSQNNRIGAYYGPSGYFDGKVSVLIAFDKIKTATEIAQLTALLKTRYIYPTQKAAMQV